MVLLQRFCKKLGVQWLLQKYVPIPATLCRLLSFRYTSCAVRMISDFRRLALIKFSSTQLFYLLDFLGSGDQICKFRALLMFIEIAGADEPSALFAPEYATMVLGNSFDLAVNYSQVLNG